MKTYIKGKFGGQFDTSKKTGIFHVLRWKLFKNTTGLLFRPKKETRPLDVISDLASLSQEEDFICWLTHASFLIQLGGKRILVDPVFGDIPFYKREIPAPYSVEALGKIDFLLLSHAHYDHCDKASIRTILPQDPKAIVPLKMSALLQEMSPLVDTYELDWYETYSDGLLSITLVPAKHWSRRGIFDRNKVLWGGYIIQYKDRSIYFAGDTAYGSHFEEIGKRYAIDIALLPIGAYRPEYIMKHNHLDPQEAYTAFEDLQATCMIPMHYGTYQLTDEPIDEPLKWMHEIAKAYPGNISFLKGGEVLSLH